MKTLLITILITLMFTVNSYAIGKVETGMLVGASTMILLDRIFSNSEPETVIIYQDKYHYYGYEQPIRYYRNDYYLPRNCYWVPVEQRRRIVDHRLVCR